MKKKVTFTTGNTRLVDWNEQKRKISVIEGKMAECTRKRDYMGYSKFRKQLDESIKALQFIEQKQMITLADLISPLGEKEKLKFSSTCCSIILLSDLIDSAATDLQSVMTKMGAPSHLNIMHAVKSIKENSAALVNLFDNISDPVEQERFGQFGDSVYNYIQMRSTAYTKNEKRRNNLKVDRKIKQAV